MDDAKVVEMLAQILQNQTEMRLELKQELHELVGKLEIRVENDDDRQVQKEATLDIMDTLKRVEAKLDVLQLETAHIRRIK